jgi:hypothetical protein
VTAASAALSKAKPSPGAASTAARMRGSCTQTGAGRRAEPGASELPASPRLQAGSSGSCRQCWISSGKSGVPPIATRAVKPPAEKPKMPIRAGSSRSCPAQSASM